jgi:hypothetical protein
MPFRSLLNGRAFVVCWHYECNGLLKTVIAPSREMMQRKAAQTSGGIVVAGAIYKGVGLVSILISCLPICFLASL